MDDSLSDTPCHALTALARDAEFQAFALQRSLSYLQACQHHQPIIGAFTGMCSALQFSPMMQVNLSGVMEDPPDMRLDAGITGGTVDVGEAVLLPGLDWQKLGTYISSPAAIALHPCKRSLFRVGLTALCMRAGAPLVRTSQMIILACAGTAPSGASSKKKAQDASDSLPGLAVQCIAALCGLCHSTADLAHLLVLLPEPASPGPDCRHHRTRTAFLDNAEEAGTTLGVMCSAGEVASRGMSDPVTSCQR